MIKNHFLILFLLSLLFMSCSRPYDNEALLELDKGWYYLWGNPNRMFEGNIDSLNKNIISDISNPVNDLESIPYKGAKTSLWLKTILPDTKCSDPSIYVGVIKNAANVYCDGKLIFSYGEMVNESEPELLGWKSHIIKLPEDFQNKTLTFHFRSDGSQIGVPDPIMFGSSYYFYNKLFYSNLDNLVIAIILLMLGIFLLSAFLSFRTNIMLSYLSITVIPMGIWLLSNNPFVHLVFDFPHLLFTADHITFFSLTIGYIMMIEHIVVEKYKSIIRKIWQLQITFILVSIVVNYLPGYTYLVMIDYFLLFLFSSLTVSFIILFKSIKHKKINDFEAKLLLIWTVIFFLSGLGELFFYLSNIESINWVYSVHFIHYGSLFFTLVFLFIMIADYLKVNKEVLIAKENALIHSQKALEAEKQIHEAKNHLTKKLITSQENERKRIALELHDSIGQNLLIIKNQLLEIIHSFKGDGDITIVNEASALTSDTLREIRSISQNLRPHHLDQLGLTTAIETVIEKVDDNSDIDFDFSLDNIDDQISTENQINFFRIIQESLNNIVKHSGASEAFVTISKSEKTIELIIEDNGNGIPNSKLNPNLNRTEGFGISGLFERADILGGELEILKSNKGGVKVFLRVPVQN